MAIGKELRVTRLLKPALLVKNTYDFIFYNCQCECVICELCVETWLLVTVRIKEHGGAPS